MHLSPFMQTVVGAILLAWVGIGAMAVGFHYDVIQVAGAGFATFFIGVAIYVKAELT